MFAVILPTSKTFIKTTENESESAHFVTSVPMFLDRALGLAKQLQHLDSVNLGKTLGITPGKTEEVEKYHSALSNKYTNGTPALHIFWGTLYKALDAKSIPKSCIAKSANRFFILSGLYGLLRPFDSSKRYRLEMGDSLTLNEGKRVALSTFWRNLVTEEILKFCQESGFRHILNLCSIEYSRALNFSQLPEEVSVKFCINTKGKLVTNSTASKRMRGLIARHIITDGITDIKDICKFQAEGYTYDAFNSITGKHIVFVK